jgi:peptidoglycan-associated lipoprotein
MNKIVWAALFAMTLSACGTTSDTKATVEDHTKDNKVATPAASEVQTAPVAAKDVMGSAYSGDPRKDPASLLSKRSVFFDFDRFEVKDEFRPMLEAHAGYLVSKRDKHVTLQGNTDERGSREYNLALGQKRAEAVRKSLAVLGVSESQMEAVSFGEEKPRATGNTEEAYAQNRRTDIVYTDE